MTLIFIKQSIDKTLMKGIAPLNYAKSFLASVVERNVIFNEVKSSLLMKELLK